MSTGGCCGWAVMFLFPGPDWLRVGLPRMGPTLPQIHPAASRVEGSGLQVIPRRRLIITPGDGAATSSG